MHVSFQTTLGVRATTRFVMGDNAVLVPEVRVGWSHEFGDASQSLSASLVGAGMSLELSPEAKVFVDYDGKLSQHFQEHSISGGLRVKF